MKKVLLAFSGGLDTSFCVKYLKEDQGYQVYTGLVDTGGFSSGEQERIAQKALDLGSSGHETLDARQEYYRDCIRYLIFGNVLRNRNYPLSVSSERSFQAEALIRHAKKLGVDAIAHGSTAAGNDQVRFDLAIRVFAPELEIITPIRDLSISRQEEREYLEKYGVETGKEEVDYSLNQGLWGTSVGGKETLTSGQALPGKAYPSKIVEEKPSELEIEFQQGELAGGVRTIQKITERAGKYGIGRDIHTGDTVLGIKGRVGFEAPAARIIIDAHYALEKHTLTHWQIYWKEQLGQWYGMMLHEGKIMDPVMRNIEAFLEDSQDKVNGKVFVRLMPRHFEILGIDSPNDLMQARYGSYGEMNRSWSGEEVRAFTKITALPYQIYHQLHSSEQC